MATFAAAAASPSKATSVAAAAAATKLVSPSHLFTCKFSGLGPAPTSILRQQHPRLTPLQLQAPKSKRPAVVTATLSSLHELTTTSTSMYEIAENVGYSLASYYTSLGLFVISVPGLWSLIKRSVKSKRAHEYQLKCSAGVSSKSSGNVDDVAWSSPSIIYDLPACDQPPVLTQLCLRLQPLTRVSWVLLLQF